MWSDKQWGKQTTSSVFHLREGCGGARNCQWSPFFFFWWHPMRTELLSCHAHLETPQQLSSGRGRSPGKSGADSRDTPPASWAVTLAGRVPYWTIFIQHWQAEYLPIREPRNAPLQKKKTNKQKTQTKANKQKTHNILETGRLAAQEDEALVALSSLRHREKFQSTAQPTHTHTLASVRD